MICVPRPDGGLNDIRRKAAKLVHKQNARTWDPIPLRKPMVLFEGEGFRRVELGPYFVDDVMYA